MSVCVGSAALITTHSYHVILCFSMLVCHCVVYVSVSVCVSVLWINLFVLGEDPRGSWCAVSYGSARDGSAGGDLR